MVLNMVCLLTADDNNSCLQLGKCGIDFLISVQFFEKLSFSSE